MPIQSWSEGIWLLELDDEPSFSEEMAALLEHLEAGAAPHVVLSLASVHHINSSNISQLLLTRHRLQQADRQLLVCNVGDDVWSILLVAGLDKALEFAPDVPSALTSLQLEE
jgi:anti-anti-sigma factor